MRNRTLLCLVSVLLCFSVFLPVFSASASAAVSNLVPPLLVNWSLQNYEGGDITVQTTGDGVSSLMIGNTGYGFVYKQLNLIQGHKYKFTVKMIQSSFQWPEASSNGFCTFGFCDSISQNKVWLSYNVFVAGDNNLLQSCEFIAGSSSVYVLIELVTNGHYCSSRLTDISIIDLGSSDTQSVIDNANQNAQDIQDNIDENTTKIGGWLSELGNKIKSIFYVKTVQPLSWVSGYASGGKFYVNSTITNQWMISEPVPGNSIVSFPTSSKITRFRIFKLSSNVNVSTTSSIKDYGAFVSYGDYQGQESVELEDGYFYVIQVNLSGLTNSQYLPFLEENVIFQADVFFVNYLLDGLINGLKSLFVPSDQALQDFKDNCSSLMEDHFGLAYSAGEIVTGEFTAVFDILADNDGDYSFTLPALDFEFMDYDIHLWDEVDAPFEEIMEIDAIDFLYSVYKVLILVIFAVTLIKYGIKVFDEVFTS